MSNIQWYEVKYQHKTDISKTIKYTYPIEYETRNLEYTISILHTTIISDLSALKDYYLADFRIVK